MSGSRNTFEIDRCYRAGANSYVCKSTHVDEIFATAVKLVAYWSSCAKLPSRQTIAANAGESVADPERRRELLILKIGRSFFGRWEK